MRVAGTALGGQATDERRGATHRGQRDEAAGVAASKVIRVPVPMSAFGGKADIVRACSGVRPVAGQI